MTYLQTPSGVAPTSELPVVRKITVADLRVALEKGFDDFIAMPTFAVFLCLIYPIVGLMLARLTLGYAVLPLLFPLAAGFALLGPFAALGLYEMSRRREQGDHVTWRGMLGVFRSPSIGPILLVGLLLMTIFVVWVAVAQAIYVAHFGYTPAASMPDFARSVLTTKTGLSLVVIGNLVGLVFAIVALAVSAVSFPLLLDRNVGAVSAIVTSVRVVTQNPVTMAVWGLIVAGALALGSLPFFLGLAVVMPILGHATWHLYRRVIAP